MEPLRTCGVCGLQVFTKADLSQFVKNRPSAYGYKNLCKSCSAAEWNEKINRGREFLEIFRARGPDGLQCHFCGEEVVKLSGRDGDSLCIHSLDGNHGNWAQTNKMPAHVACHLRYHNTGEKSYNWRGDKASDSAKRSRGYKRPRR